MSRQISGSARDPSPMTDAVRPSAHPAIENLRACRRQLDMDGCEVGVSRQALDEALAITAELLEALMEAYGSLVDYVHAVGPAGDDDARVMSNARAAIAKAVGTAEPADGGHTPPGTDSTGGTQS